MYAKRLNGFVKLVFVYKGKLFGLSWIRDLERREGQENDNGVVLCVKKKRRDGHQPTLWE